MHGSGRMTTGDLRHEPVPFRSRHGEHEIWICIEKVPITRHEGDEQARLSTGLPPFYRSFYGDTAGNYVLRVRYSGTNLDHLKPTVMLGLCFRVLDKCTAG